MRDEIQSLFFPHDKKVEHFKALDGLRGVAVLLVLLSHSSNENLMFFGPPGVGKTHLSIALGYTPIDRKEANLFFNLISEMYKRTSIIITSNKDFDQWSEMMGDEIMTTAMLDRLLHHAHVFSLDGGSYRIQEKKEV